MNKEPTEAQILSQWDFGRTSHIAGRFNLNPKYLLELRRVVKQLNITSDELHELIDIMAENNLL